MERPIAKVKWEQRPFALIRYTDNLPGLVFGIVKLVDCKTKWEVDKPSKDKIVKCRVEKEYNRIGRIKFIGNYVDCGEEFSNCMFNYSNGLYFKEKMHQDPIPVFQKATKVLKQTKINNFFKI